MPVLAPIKVLVWADKMLSPELGVGHATARVHHALRWCGGHVAARDARAAVGDADDWVSQHQGACDSANLVVA